jgi:S-adenosylmethionine:tRNA ribosyltransferase-isomerase
METKDFLFDLPEELIAKYPPEKRGQSRLMTLDRRTGKRQYSMTANLPELLAGPEFRSTDGEAPLLVFNNSRVRKARLKAKPMTHHPNSGTLPDGVMGQTEFLLLNRIDSHTWRTMVNRAKRRRPKQRFCFSGGLEGEIVEAPMETTMIANNTICGNEFRYLRFDSPIDDDWLDIHGHMPLPPYIKRDDETSDCERYQTIYADRASGASLYPGASTAAPTAGLHFTEKLFVSLWTAKIDTVFITLHVGPGTFLPVRTSHIENHVMHKEAYTINNEAALQINAAKAAGRKIVAVGTTSVRTLESAWTGGEKGHVKAGAGISSVFIYPGYRFNVVDALFTNFHTPGSTLLMLVSAFAGRELILESYAEAVQKKYRFFSYGDAMLIW